MKKYIVISSVLLMVVTMQFCGRGIYTNPVFLEKTAGHRVIAILPFEMIFTGKKPKKLSIEDAAKLEEVESIAFQRSLYQSLFHETTRYRNPLRIDIQAITKTNRILDKNGIGIRESWRMDEEELAGLLGVDAVVRTRVIKRRYMSGLASFGIEVGTSILNAILEDSPLFLILPTTTNRIKAECYICNGLDGSLLWEYSVVDETDWRLEANAIVDGVTRHFARRFPYR